MSPGTNINIADVPGNKPSFVFNLWVGMRTHWCLSLKQSGTSEWEKQLHFLPLHHKTAIQVFLFNPLPRSDPSQQQGSLSCHDSLSTALASTPKPLCLHICHLLPKSLIILCCGIDPTHCPDPVQQYRPLFYWSEGAEKVMSHKTILKSFVIHCMKRCYTVVTHLRYNNRN